MSDVLGTVRELGVLRVAGVFEFTAGDRGIAPCPACGEEHRGKGDKRAPVGLTADGKGWHCHRCSEKGDAVTLAAWKIVGKSHPEKSEWKEILEKLEQLGLADPKNHPAPTAIASTSPTERLPDGQALTAWSLCVPVTDEPDVRAWLVERHLDPEALADRDLVRAHPANGFVAKWMSRHGRPWNMGAQQYRVIVPLFDEHGAIASIHARALHPQDPKGKDKAASPKGYTMTGLVMADEMGRAMLDGRSRELRAGVQFANEVLDVDVVIVEGVPDFLSATSTWSTSAERVPAVLGVISGSWTRELALRIPHDARVVVATHPDARGEEYAQKIFLTLADRCEVLRWAPATTEEARP